MKRLLISLFALLCCAALVALVPTSASAVDGVILINQNTAINGLGGCDTPGFPITICNPGSYRLSGNLTVTSATMSAISIEVGDVFLDLNGFQVKGTGTCSGSPGSPVTDCSGSSASGIFSNYPFTTIRNGSVSGFQVGVHLLGEGGTVETIHLRDNTKGAILFGSARLCSAHRNWLGFDIIGLAEGNVATNNYFGILVSWGSGVNNVARGNNTGLGVMYATFGSNGLRDNVTDIWNRGGATSQNNNNCSGSTC